MRYNIDKISNIMDKHGFIRILLNKNPTWVHEQTKEGLQINERQEIISFVAKNGERVLDLPDSIEIEKIKREIQLSNEPVVSQESAPIKKTEILDNIDNGIKFVNQIPNVLLGNRIVVPQDIEELKSLSTFDRMLLFQKTDQRFVKYLDKNKDRPYLEGNLMKMEANIAFLYKWSSKIDGWDIRDNKAVACWGSIKVNIEGTDIVVSGVGIDKQIYIDHDITKPVLSIPEMMKNAVTDMKKKCLADLGFNNDVYRNDIRSD